MRLCRMGSVLFAAGVLLGAVAEPSRPRELGQVRWGRDLGAALERSGAEGRPVFLLFQEVPGCSTCGSFGDRVLSHPLLVEAIEAEFIPIFVHNNRPGPEAEILSRYAEPAWNNPVVRFVNGAGRDVIPRRAAVWTPHAIAARMVRALETSGREVPGYLRDAVYELTPRPTQRATFGMSCYWSGEACLGGLPGVLESRTGSLRRWEVVEVRFDPERISYAELVKEVGRRGCADRVFAHGTSQRAAAAQVFGSAAIEDAGPLRAARESDQKYYLRRSPLRDLALTPRQALRVNSSLAEGLDPGAHLSPRQRAGLTR